ncbi:MAG TPA: ABC transporter substrate-binding protein, partial [Candidatus Binatia bacterium]|nr:ABC transporter substrate-binding protein [Candidatus Binatia bacterium]
MNHALYFDGASGFSVKEYSLQRHRAAEPQPKKTFDPLLHPPPQFCGGGKRWGRMPAKKIAQAAKSFIADHRELSGRTSPQRLRGESHGSRKFHFVKRVGLLALTSIVFACAGAHAQTKMTIAYSSIGPMASGVWMAKESGAFDKYGIQADIILITSGPVSVQSLIGGDLQAVSAASNAVINAILNGAPIIAVGGTANRPYHRLFVQPEINRLEDLRGKTLGVTRFGSITDNLTRILLRRNGLEGAVNVRQMGGTIEVAAAFQNRLIAGAVTSELRVTPPSTPKILVRLVDMG